MQCGWTQERRVARDYAGQASIIGAATHHIYIFIISIFVLNSVVVVIFGLSILRLNCVWWSESAKTCADRAIVFRTFVRHSTSPALLEPICYIQPWHGPINLLPNYYTIRVLALLDRRELLARAKWSRPWSTYIVVASHQHNRQRREEHIIRIIYI